MPWLLLALGISSAALTLNAFRPARGHWALIVPGFLLGWLVSELPLHGLLWQWLWAGLFVGLGGLGGWPGQLGLLLCLASSAGLLALFLQSRAAEAVLEAAVCEALGKDYRARCEPTLPALTAPALSLGELALPFRGTPRSLKRTRDIVYARQGGIKLKLDVYQSRERREGCPVLLQIHGGAWMFGRKDDQGLPLMRLLASRGWVCVSANYRLSPLATFPDPLLDLKRAVAWIREHIHEYGGDPDFLAITGGSAGGHLAALLALTANEPEYQPGFEGVDTRAQACVPVYGVYDFTDRHNLHGRPFQRMLEQYIMKARRAEAPERYEKASPVSLVRADAPPFFVIHGELDSLVPVEEARRFVERLRAASRAPVAYAELPGAQHAFEIFGSMRTFHTNHAVERFLALVYSEHLRARRRR